MTATADDLARRLVESPRWPHPGPISASWTTLARNPDSGLLWVRASMIDQWLPALSHDDPATEGCLRHLASDAWGRFVAVRPVDRPGGLGFDAYGMDPEHGWAPLVDPDGRHVSGRVPGEALAHAILAAPGVPHGR